MLQNAKNAPKIPTKYLRNTPVNAPNCKQMLELPKIPLKFPAYARVLAPT
jgi:hypothetical protein